MVVLNPSWIRISGFHGISRYDSLVSGTGHSHQYFLIGPWGTLNLSARLRSTWGGSAGIFCSSEPEHSFPALWVTLFATSKFLTFTSTHYKLQRRTCRGYQVQSFPGDLSLNEWAGLIFFSLTLHISQSILCDLNPVLLLSLVPWTLQWSPSNEM